MNRNVSKPKKKSTSQSKKESTNNTKNTKPSSNGPADNPKEKTNNESAKIRNNKPNLKSSTTTSSSALDNAAANAKPPTNTTQFISDLPPIRKMERAHSFFLTRKLSQIYNNLTTGSKDNLSKITESSEPLTAASIPPSTTMPPAPFKFTRSLSMASIPIRQSFRRVFRENKLEKLHEENSSEKVDAIVSTVQIKANDLVDRPSISSKVGSVELRSGFSPTTSDGSAQHQPPTESKQRERRSSFRNTIYELGRTISGHSDKPITTRWSASLASLQHIDTMVSYEDLSFIDYDKFNTYEQMLAKQRRQRKKHLLNDSTGGIQPSPTMSIRSATISQTSPSIALLPSPVMTSNSKVVRRRKQNIQLVDHNPCQQHQLEQNFDQPKNLYRQSLDDTKLKFLQRVSRQSFRLSDLYDDQRSDDILQVDRVQRSVSQQTLLVGSDGVDGDNVDGDSDDGYVDDNLCCANVTTVPQSTAGERVVRSKSFPGLCTSCFVGISGFRSDILSDMVSRCYIIISSAILL